MISLQRESIIQETYEGQHVWPLKITATSSQQGLASEVFVFHASMGDDLYCGDVFEVVASVQQMTDIPVDNPGMDANGELVPYYRKDSLSFMARSPSEAEELWECIKEDIDDLSRNWAALTNLQADGSTSSTIVLDENVNAGARDLTNIENLGIRTTVPEYAIDIDPHTNPTTPDRGIRFGGDVGIHRTDVNTLNITGNLLINGIPIASAIGVAISGCASYTVTGEAASEETITLYSSDTLHDGRFFFTFNLITYMEDMLLGVQTTGVVTIETGSTTVMSDINYKIIVGTTDAIPRPDIDFQIIGSSFQVTITNKATSSCSYSGTLILDGKHEETPEE